MSPANPLYFNRYQGDPKTEPMAAKWSVNTLKKVYEYEPVPTELDAANAGFIIGAEGAIWTEFFKTNREVQYMILPRLLALSELTWSEAKSKNWDNFQDKMRYQFKLFDLEKLNYDKKDLNFEMKK